MFEYEINPPLDTSQLVQLFARAGWEDSDPASKLEWAVASSEEWVTCTVEGELVGFGRTFRLDAVQKVVFDVVVDERFEGYGVDEEIVQRLSQDLAGGQEVVIFRQDDVEGIAGWDWSQEVDYWAPPAPPGAYLG
jgi:hypothetical protein